MSTRKVESLGRGKRKETWRVDPLPSLRVKPHSLTASNSSFLSPGSSSALALKAGRHLCRSALNFARARPMRKSSRPSPSARLLPPQSNALKRPPFSEDVLELLLSELCSALFCSPPHTFLLVRRGSPPPPPPSHRHEQPTMRLFSVLLPTLVFASASVLASGHRRATGAAADLPAPPTYPPPEAVLAPRVVVKSPKMAKRFKPRAVVVPR